LADERATRKTTEENFKWLLGRARLLREICREEKIEEDDIIDVFVVVVCSCVSFASIHILRTDQSTSAIFFFFISFFLCMFGFEDSM
jgi:hypothetical protein